MQPVIILNHVSKKYRHYAARSIRDAFSNILRTLPGRKPKNPENDWFWAIKDLDFQVMPGQTLGVIGPNGAGKTTTLKLLSRITQPTQGDIKVNGRVSALIELGAGFHPDLTGRENVFLNGTILGMSRREISARFDEIVEFANLQAFIDTPVKYYSSGMYARLGFSVAAHTNPNLLLVDEVLAVGDYSFQQQCYQRMRDLQQQGTTILLVSHNLAAINDICSEVIVLKQGQMVFQGPAVEGIAEYASLTRQNIKSKDGIKIGEDAIAQRVMTHEARILGVKLLNKSGQIVKMVKSGETVFVSATIEFFEKALHPNFACFMYDSQGRLIYDQTTFQKGIIPPDFQKGETAEVTFELNMNVVQGIYHIGLDLHYSDLSCFYDRVESAVSVVVTDSDGSKGIADLGCQFLFSSPFNN